MDFPGWGPFEGPDSADLDDAAWDSISSVAVSVPEGVQGPGATDRRQALRHPTVLVCPEYNPVEARKWIDAGDVTELSRATNVSFADIDSGHWPMVSQPVELARILARHFRLRPRREAIRPVPSVALRGPRGSLEARLQPYLVR